MSPARPVGLIEVPLVEHLALPLVRPADNEGHGAVVRGGLPDGVDGGPKLVHRAVGNVSWLSEFLCHVHDNVAQSRPERTRNRTKDKRR